MNKNFKNMSIGAIASVIAGAYYMYGSKEGVAKRKQLHAWSIKLKGEVLQGIEKLKEVTEPKYKELVKTVSEKYKNVDKGELKKVVDDLTSTWNKMKKDVQVEIAKKQAIIDKENAAKAKINGSKPTSKSNSKTSAKPSTKTAMKAKTAAPLKKAAPMVKRPAPKKNVVKSVEVSNTSDRDENIVIENTERNDSEMK